MCDCRSIGPAPRWVTRLQVFGSASSAAGPTADLMSPAILQANSESPSVFDLNPLKRKRAGAGACAVNETCDAVVRKVRMGESVGIADNIGMSTLMKRRAKRSRSAESSGDASVSTDGDRPGSAMSVSSSESPAPPSARATPVAAAVHTLPTLAESPAK